MTKMYCDICGKEIQIKEVRNDNDPLDYLWGGCGITIDIGLQGIYEVGFQDVCHECKQRIENIDMDDFHEALRKLMGLKAEIKEG